MLMGPATLVAVSIVIAAVFPDLPIVKPDSVPPRVMLLRLNALVKLARYGVTVKVPVVVRLNVEEEKLSAMKVTFPAPRLRDKVPFVFIGVGIVE